MTGENKTGNETPIADEVPTIIDAAKPATDPSQDDIGPLGDEHTSEVETIVIPLDERLATLEQKFEDLCGKLIALGHRI